MKGVKMVLRFLWRIIMSPKMRVLRLQNKELYYWGMIHTYLNKRVSILVNRSGLFLIVAIAITWQKKAAVSYPIKTTEISFFKESLLCAF